MNKNKKTSIPFNKPTLLGDEQDYLLKVIESKSLGGDGFYTQKCHNFFKINFDFKHSFLTHSCTSALEISAALCDLKETDEVIIPSYSYITDASSFAKTAAKMVFADSQKGSPNISCISIRQKINSNTKVLLIVHYAGIACDMDEIMAIVKEFDLILIEDCAQAIGGKYKGKFLGEFGHMSTFSFHETKNIQCGEGGLLVVNDHLFLEKANLIWNEGTNKKDYLEGKAPNYQWMTIGSSYQPSELTAAFLYCQLQSINEITERRKRKWRFYYDNLKSLQDRNKLPQPFDKNINAHIFYLKLQHKDERNELQLYLKEEGINATFHFLPLHQSSYWLKLNDHELIPNAETWSDCLLRLPLYDSISLEEQKRVVGAITNFFKKRS